MKEYRVGILGFGFIGKVHAYAYRTLPFYCDPVPLAARLTHVVTSRTETAEAARRLIGADRAATDHREVTENPDVDIVHICTPNHLHAEALLAAIRHGKHIYCDKPLCADAAEAEAVRAALADYRGTAQMTFHNRFFPATLRAKALVEEGALGRILQFRAAYLHSGNVDAAAPARWKLTRAGGGGVIADLASHVVDLVDHLIGPLAATCALTTTAYPERPAVGDPSRRVAVDAEDCVLALARMESGAVGTVESSKLATGSEDELRLEIHGTGGAIRFNLMDPHHLEYCDASVPHRPLGGTRGFLRIACGHRYEAPATSFPSPKASVGWLRAHVECLAHFLRAVAAGQAAQPDLLQGVRVQQLMESLRLSAEGRGWVDV